MKTNAILLALLIFCMSLAGCVGQSQESSQTLTGERVSDHGVITMQCTSQYSISNVCDDDDASNYWHIIQNFTTMSQDADEMIILYASTGMIENGMRIGTDCSDGGIAGWISLGGNGPWGEYSYAHNETISESSRSPYEMGSSMSYIEEGTILAFPGEECVHTIYSTWFYTTSIDIHWNILYEVVEL